MPRELVAALVVQKTAMAVATEHTKKIKQMKKTQPHSMLQKKNKKARILVINLSFQQYNTQTILPLVERKFRVARAFALMWAGPSLVFISKKRRRRRGST
jgi:hypothetical protein